MTTSRQTKAVVASAILAPSSDADEGLLVPRPRSGSSTRPSAGGIEDNSFHDTISADGGRGLAASHTYGNQTKLTPEQHAPLVKHAPTVLKELKPLVAMPPPSDAATHSRLTKHVYSRLGRNLLFEARPAVVHFGGYVLGKPHSQRVRIVNISRTSQRLHILGPATDCFKMRCSKKGLVAPGSSEVITVDFHPREHRYHYDCLRLHTDSENLLVPLHGYPVMNDVVFPERLDFGVHALGETVRRTVKMVCKVPIQFEFEVEVIKLHPHFTVGPLRGIVPANGAAEVHIEHTPFNASSAEMKLLVSVSQFNFTPIECTVTGAGRPGVVREATLNATASALDEDNTLRDSLGPTASSHAKAQARKLRGQNARHRQHQQERERQRERQRQTQGARATELLRGGGDGRRRSGRGGAYGEGSYDDSERVDRQEKREAHRWMGEGGSAMEEMAAGCNVGRSETTDVCDGTAEGTDEEVVAAEEGADLLDTWATRPTEAEQHPYRTGKGSGAVFDAGGEWLAGEKRGEFRQPTDPWAPPMEGSAFGSNLGGPTKTTVVEGLVIPARLNTVQATNFVLTQQPGKLKPKDLKEAIRRTRADRQRQLQEQEVLRSVTARTSTTTGNFTDHNGIDDHKRGAAFEDPERGCGIIARERQQQSQPAQLSGRVIRAYEATTAGSARDGGAATRQLKEMSFLQDLADTEVEERDRSFKASVEHVGEPLLTSREIARALEERQRRQRGLRRRLREAERGFLETRYRGPGEVGTRYAKASLLLTGDGTQGIGFRHEPDWDVYKNDDWGRRREVLRRLVNAIGTWITRRRAGRRLEAIQARLDGLQDRTDVAAMVERDNHEAKLTAGPPAGAFQDSWKSPVEGSAANVDDDNSGWKFPELLVTSEALAAEMLSESMTISASSSAHVDQCGDSSRGGGGGEGGGAAGRRYKRSSAMPTPPPPEFRLSTGDINRHRFPMYDEGAALLRREEMVDAAGPPTDFVDIDLLPLREPEEGRSMGYASVLPPGLGTYPSIETSRPLRWSAFEECGVRQPRDEEEEPCLWTDGRKASGVGLPPPAAGWREALSSTERRASKATLGRRRSSVGLRMLPATVENIEEAWLPAAEAELTALAAEAEMVDRMPDTLLLRPPPPGGVDLMTPDPRYKAFLMEILADEASPEWCLRPQEIPREVPATKGLLLGYSAGTTTLRAYAGAPRLSNLWRPKRERRSSGLACMRGQASRGVWQPIRVPASPPPAGREAGVCSGRSSGSGVVGSGVVTGVGSARNTSSRGGGGSVGGGGGGSGSGDARGGRGEREFRLAADHVTAAAAAGDGLSDSESEDDEDDAPMPTPTDARLAFENTAAAGSVSGEARGAAAANATGGSSETSIKLPSGAGFVLPEEGGGGRGKGFARDNAIKALEDKRRKQRIGDAETLADRMDAISAEVRNVKHAFVLQTPFHRIQSGAPDDGIT